MTEVIWKGTLNYHSLSAEKKLISESEKGTNHNITKGIFHEDSQNQAVR